MVAVVVAFVDVFGDWAAVLVCLMLDASEAVVVHAKVDGVWMGSTDIVVDDVGDMLMMLLVV